MPETPTPPASFVWRSGDFTEPPRKDPPYNGLEIVAVPTHDDEGELSLLAVTVNDFSKNENGITRVHAFESVGGGESFRLEPSGDFTAKGSLELGRMSSLPADVVLFIDLFYGLPDDQHHAIGGILAIPLARSFDAT